MGEYQEKEARNYSFAASLAGKAAIVTGATRGIGRAIACGLADCGANLVIGGTKEAQLKELAKHLEQRRGISCLAAAGDIAEKATAERLAQSCLEAFGRIDVLINNAGIMVRTPFLDTPEKDWRRLMEVNYHGPLYACQAVLPQMIRQKSGSIVNISSAAAKTSHGNSHPSYGASKAALLSLTQKLALDMGPYGIRVNAVCPGPTASEMTQEWDEDYRHRVLAQIPLGRLGTAEEQAAAVLFLASDLAGFITGESINVNGGRYMN